MMKYLILMLFLLFALSCNKNSDESIPVLAQEVSERGDFVEHYEVYDIENLEPNDLNIENLGIWHKAILSRFITFVCNEPDSIITGNIEFNIENFIRKNTMFTSEDTFPNISEIIDCNDACLPSDIMLSNQAIQYTSLIKDILDSGSTVDEVQNALLDIKTELEDSSLPYTEKLALSCGISVGISSYLFWAPFEIDGFDASYCLTENIHNAINNDNEIQFRWSDWRRSLGIVAWSDVTGAIGGAMRSVILLGPGNVAPGATLTAATGGALYGGTMSSCMSALAQAGN